MIIFSNTYSLRIVGQNIYNNWKVYRLLFLVKYSSKMDMFLCTK